MPIYSDLNLTFAKHPGTRDVLKRVDLDAVKNAVRNLILTNRGEKLFMPNFGGDLRGLLFEPLNSVTADLLKRRWNEMLDMYESRAVINTLSVTHDSSAEIYIVLDISMKDNPDITFTLPISVERVR